MTERHPLGKVGGGGDLRESKEAKSTRESMLRDRKKKWESNAFLSNSERADLQSRMALAP